MSVFETLSRDEWIAQGAGQSARKGEYSEILAQMAESGQRYFRIDTAANGNGRFAGKKASAVATALKQARDAKGAPENLSTIQITSKSEKGAEGIGVVFVENTAVDNA